MASRRRRTWTVRDRPAARRRGAAGGGAAEWVAGRGTWVFMVAADGSLGSCADVLTKPDAGVPIPLAHSGTTLWSAPTRRRFGSRSRGPLPLRAYEPTDGEPGC